MVDDPADAYVHTDYTCDEEHKDEDGNVIMITKAIKIKLEKLQLNDDSLLVVRIPNDGDSEKVNIIMDNMTKVFGMMKINPVALFVSDDYDFEVHDTEEFMGALGYVKKEEKEG